MARVRSLPWYGGKQGESKGEWIAGLLPWAWHTCYVEPFGGMAGVLLARDPVRKEIYNDLNQRVVNWWRVVRQQRQEFGEQVEALPHSRVEFEWAIDRLDDKARTDLERALAFHAVVWMSLPCSDRAHPSQFRRMFSPQSGSTGRWRSERVAALAERMWHVQLECQDACGLMETLVEREYVVMYVDPPYRDGHTDTYAVCEVDEARLAALLRQQRGKVAISGYGDEWDHLGWQRHEKKVTFAPMGQHHAGMGKGDVRTEVLWTNFDPVESGVRLL